MSISITKHLKTVLYVIVAPIYLGICVLVIAGGRFMRPRDRRVIFGVSPLISNIYWCRALRQNGLDARTWMTSTPSILSEDSFDVDFSQRFGALAPVAMAVYFLKTLARPTLVFTTCDGFLLGTSILWRLEAHLLAAGKSRIVVVPYGGDAYVYSEVRSDMTRQALQFSYPGAARNQRQISRHVHYWVRNADIFIPGVMHADGFGRADVVTPSPFCIDLDEWVPAPRKSDKDQRKPLVVTHAPNHRGFKGTEFVVKAVENLVKEGLEMELHLLERKSNAEVRRVLLEDSDIHVEQLIADGYAFNAVEAMAARVPVIANLENREFTTPLRTWSFLSQCPIVSASPETIEAVLRDLYHNRSKLDGVGLLSREYVSRYHSLESFRVLYSAIERKLEDDDYPLWSMYASESD